MGDTRSKPLIVVKGLLFYVSALSRTRSGKPPDSILRGCIPPRMAYGREPDHPHSTSPQFASFATQPPFPN